jgi:hypothetical protein
MIPGSMGMSLALRYSSDQNLLWCLEPESHLHGGGQLRAAAHRRGSARSARWRDANSQDRYYSAVPAHLLGEPHTRHEVASARRAEEDPVVRDEVSRHGYRLGVGYSVRVVDDIQTKREVVGNLIAVRGDSSRGVSPNRTEECTHPVDAYPFDHGVHLMPPLSPLTLLVIIHDIILYFVEQARSCLCQRPSLLQGQLTFWIGQDHLDLRHMLLEVYSRSRYRSSGTFMRPSVAPNTYYPIGERRATSNEQLVNPPAPLTNASTWPLVWRKISGPVPW